jgi:tellurite methyltransferase
MDERAAGRGDIGVIGAAGAAMSFDDAYEKTKDLFGATPEQILIAHYRRMDSARPVLDVGVGQGRNALFLARRGFTVDAIDPSIVAVETVSAAARGEHLPIRTHACAFDAFVSSGGPYSGILLFGLLPLLTWTEIGLLRKRTGQWTGPGSLVFVTAFSTADAKYAVHSQTWQTIGPNSFAGPDGAVRTYLKPGEVLALFDGYKAVHHWEGIGLEHRHGEGAVERHAMVEAVFER